MSRNNATMSDMKHALEGISGRLDITGEKTDELENTVTPTVKMTSLSMILRIGLRSWRSQRSELGFEF